MSTVKTLQKSSDDLYRAVKRDGIYQVLSLLADLCSGQADAHEQRAGHRNKDAAKWGQLTADLDRAKAKYGG